MCVFFVIFLLAEGEHSEELLSTARSCNVLNDQIIPSSSSLHSNFFMSVDRMRPVRPFLPSMVPSLFWVNPSLRNAFVDPFSDRIQRKWYSVADPMGFRFYVTLIKLLHRSRAGSIAL